MGRQGGAGLWGSLPIALRCRLPGARLPRVQHPRPCRPGQGLARAHCRQHLHSPQGCALPPFCSQCHACMPGSHLMLAIIDQSRKHALHRQHQHPRQGCALTRVCLQCHACMPGSHLPLFIMSIIYQEGMLITGNTLTQLKNALACIFPSAHISTDAAHSNTDAKFCAVPVQARASR